MRAICACSSPHRAAKRLVQSTFLIGFAMRKVLSICRAIEPQLILAHDDDRKTNASFSTSAGTNIA